MTDPLSAGTPPFWTRPAAELAIALQSSEKGLALRTAAERLVLYGPNRIAPASRSLGLRLFLRQFSSPLMLVLLMAAVVAAVSGEPHEALIIIVILLLSCTIGFTQEWSASRAMQALRHQLAYRVSVIRGGETLDLPAEDVVPGDVVCLRAGSLIPADGLVLESCDLNVSEAALTGETFPTLKTPGTSAPDAPVGKRSNAVFAGTSVRSGTGRMLVACTGRDTEFAGIAASLERQIPETDFARGLRKFGILMTQIMTVLVVGVLAANLLLHRPVIDSLLFSVALAVGITPELLPAIVSVTLARGARRMARDGVIVRRLEAIENLGSMTVLCTDKTGTLTEGHIELHAAYDPFGETSEAVLTLARNNAALQSGLPNPLDSAILEAGATATGAVKCGEVPYDFHRKRLSVAIQSQDQRVLICKGAVANVLEVCTDIAAPAGPEPLTDARRAEIDTRFQAWSQQGFRVLAVATRTLPDGMAVARSAECRMALNGFLLFLDPLKPGITHMVTTLASRGIRLKIISGDNRYIAAHTGELIGLSSKVLTGEALDGMSRDALFAAAARTDIFAEIGPSQKERIIAALRQAGHVVGYMGDGINDAPALVEADIGISVNNAVEVAREAADMVLLHQDLGVLLTGIRNGRQTFANTLKYISITTSANFGNMISMALASIFLPFLPLLPKQILLNNLLSDIPAMAIAADRVEPGALRSPRRWDIGFVSRFMICFGLISTFFDVVTFVFLFHMADAAPAPFQTGWFLESLLTEIAIVFIIRSRKPLWSDHPGRWLTRLSAATAVVAVALPYSPVAQWLGFVPLPIPIVGGLLGITFVYLATTEAAKRAFFAYERRWHHAHGRLPRRASRR